VEKRCGGVREDRENSEAVICAGTRHGRRKGAGWFPCPSYSGPAVRNDAQLHFAIELVPEKDTRIEPHRSIDRNMPKPGKDDLGGGRNWNTAAVSTSSLSRRFPRTARHGTGVELATKKEHHPRGPVARMRSRFACQGCARVLITAVLGRPPRRDRGPTLCKELQLCVSDVKVAAASFPVGRRARALRLRALSFCTPAGAQRSTGWRQNGEADAEIRAHVARPFRHVRPCRPVRASRRVSYSSRPPYMQSAKEARAASRIR
jgi:hypothetical protein